MDGSDSEEEQANIKEEQFHNDGRKMTDEEKRKNFLERNRFVAIRAICDTMLMDVQSRGVEMQAAKEAVACQFAG